jgi:D-beta-D-heptose 7-phosphate kinase/D-beta-D-heptose 1-phosphate adenosyltransferase
MNNSKILVIGDLILDRYLFGKCDRISPEAPVPIVDLETEKLILGGASNVANNLKALGVNVLLFGLIGDDNYGKELQNLLESKSIDNILVSVKNRKTTVKTRIASNSQQLLRLDSETNFNINKVTEDLIIKKIIKLIPEFSIVLISDYNKGFLTNRVLSEIITFSRKNNVKVIVDPKTPPFSKYSGADIIKPNKKEAKSETGLNIIDFESFKLASKKIQENTGIPVVIITLSEDGVGVSENQLSFHFPTKAKEIHDVTGAGDTFVAAFSFGLLINESLQFACELANYASSIVISKQGCEVIEKSEVLNFIKKYKNHEFKHK